MVKRLRDYGVEIGKMDPGKRNKISDVEGVLVGHQTLADGDCQTGVTAIIPHQGNLFQEKLVASTHTINGFGKSMGLTQIEELGTIETPIVLTNTLNSGTAFSAVADYIMATNKEIGRETGTVNPIIGECNDMYLNDVRAQFVQKSDVIKAIHAAERDFQEGSVGAGRGMLCYSLKGGIGSSSRLVELSHGTYTLGVLTLVNFGQLSDLMINGHKIGLKLADHLTGSGEEKDRGSVMIIVATDLPVSERQLNRMLKRTVTGLSRTGSIIGSGSGEIAIGFSTATTIPHNGDGRLVTVSMIHEDDMDDCFRAVGEATEEAVLNALLTATPVVGRNGHERPTLRSLLNESNLSL